MTLPKPDIHQAAKLQQSGKLEEAKRIYIDLLAANPRDFNAGHLLGVVHIQQGDAQGGARLIRTALQVKPNDAAALSNLGNALSNLGDYAEALASYDRALAVKPDFIDALVNRGNALRYLKRIPEAVASFDRAIALAPASADARLNRGTVLKLAKKYEAALQDFDAALALDPNNAQAHNNRATLLKEMRRDDEALAGYDRAIALRPTFADPHVNRGNLLKQQKKLKEAAESYARALPLKHDNMAVEGFLFHTRMLMSDWTGYRELAAALPALAAKGVASTPFVLLAAPSSAADQLACAKAYAARFNPALPPLSTGHYNHRKIRIAYLSADYWQHATAQLMAGVFEAHDRDTFETYALAFGPNDGSPMRSRLEKAFDHFIDINTMDDAQAAQWMRDNEIDIAVDLKGFTQDARTDIFARRPAPVQVNFLGYPGTMGAAYMDYIIADRTIIPEDAQRFYTEKVAYLPNCYQPNDKKRAVAATTGARSTHGLPEKGFVFCSFNNNYKVTPEIFDVWMRLLKEVQGSVLWQLELNQNAADNLRREATARGVAPERLVFAPRMEPADHLARQRHADLFLDTIYYNAHTTASDALWVGLPVITCLGETFAGRVAASLLKAAGLPELVTTSLKEYEALALIIAREPATLAALKDKLAKNRDTCALFDTEKYTRDLEKLFIQMLPAAAKPVAGASAEALVIRANTQLSAGKYAEALETLDQAIALQPDYFGAHLNRGNALSSLGRLREAVDSYDRVIALKPDMGDAWFNSGNILTFLKDYEGALARYTRAATLLPQMPDAHSNMGSTLVHLKRHEEALAPLDRALALRPGHAQTLVNKGSALQELKKFPEAMECLRGALMADPSFVPAYISCGYIQIHLRQYREAIESFSRALALAPDTPFIEGARLHARMLLCDWSGYAAATQSVCRGIDAEKKVTVPFEFMALPSTAAQQLACAAGFAAAMYPALPPLWRGEKYAHDKIRIAYVSADFHGHATAHLMAGLFEAHDRKRFHITAISFSPDDGNPMIARLKAGFDEFIDVSRLGDAEIAQLIRAREIDIAVDLKGYTQDARASIFARRPAPVQVNYLGYPGTMGAPYIDYIIGDDIVTPPEHARFYSEKIIRLPGSYQPNDRKRAIAPATPPRTAHGLPETGFVFCCFNNHYKITPEIFTVWMRLLKNVPGSVLWLLEPNAAAVASLRAEAQKAGITPERLAFAPRTTAEDHLARHRHAGLFLDTLYYNAHTTASDALWTGLPVITCLGETFAGRVAASLVTAAGLPELVTHSLAEYEALALKLARDPAALNALKEKLAMNRDTCALFDTEKYARALEKAYEGMLLTPPL